MTEEFDVKRAVEVADWFSYKFNKWLRDDLKQDILIAMWEAWPRKIDVQLTLKHAIRKYTHRKMNGSGCGRLLVFYEDSPANWAKTVELLIDLEKINLTELERSAILDRLQGRPLKGNKRAWLTWARDRLGVKRRSKRDKICL